MSDFRPSAGSVALNLVVFWAGSFRQQFLCGFFNPFLTVHLLWQQTLVVPRTTAKKDLSLSAIMENAVVSAERFNALVGNYLCELLKNNAPNL